jgi:hypothetical protein
MPRSFLLKRFTKSECNKNSSGIAFSLQGNVTVIMCVRLSV